MQFHLEGAPNFRDFGGLPTTDGRRVRRGWLYRSDALDTLTAADLQTLDRLQFRTLCDLRSLRERAECPSRLPPGWTAQLLTANEGAEADRADIAHAFRREMYADAARGRRYMLRTYCLFPAQFAALLRELFGGLAEGRGPLLVHCAAGKDRTGFVCAMLHHALGVSREALLANYLLSDRYFGAARIAKVIAAYTGEPIEPELLDPFRVHAEYLEALIAGLEAEYGSVDAYLEVRAGLTVERRQALCERLTEAG